MGPKKLRPKRENEANLISIDDPVNTDSWRCVVVMAVERTSLDGFVLKEFSEEARSGRRRREVTSINYEQFVLKIIDDFANGELDFKYSFLLRFSAIFQEAAEYAKNKLDIPVSLLVKVVKALLFFFREESLLKIEKKKMGPQDPVQAMSERPANLELSALKAAKSNPEKKEEPNPVKKKKATLDHGGEVKVRPPSMTKEETKLLKRGEGGQEMQCIDDSPFNGYFNLYVLLIGFYYSEFPMELIKAQVPLHGLLCIDTTLSGLKRNTSSTYGKFQKRNFQPKCAEIKLFWNEFLKILWNPELSFYFKEVIFQVYSPRKLLCKNKELREFIYREISYLMYDLSDYKRQHLHYLKNMRLWTVKETEKIEMKERYNFELDDLPNECLSVPIMLQFILDVICGEDGKDYTDGKSSSFDTLYSESSQTESIVSQSVMAKNGSSTMSPDWSQMICEPGNVYTLNVYSKLKELDFKYNLNEKNYSYSSLNKILNEKKSDAVSCCIKRNRIPAENIENALNVENGIFGSYWKQCKKKFNLGESSLSFALDYCLYALLLSKITCQYQVTKLLSSPSADSWVKSEFPKTKSSFEIISNVDKEMQKPHFTVTDCSRRILKCIPYNLKETNRDFFCPREFKIVTPEKAKISSAPELHTLPHLINEVSFISDLVVPDEFMSHIEWDVYKNIKEFLGSRTFSNLNGFDMIEELSRPKLLEKEYQIWNEYNCVDYAYSVLTDSLLVVVHNRKDNHNSYHEAFNCKLRTRVGLRDFFEYILEDESKWFSEQEKLHKKQISFMANKAFEIDSFNSFVDSDFWLEGSIKYPKHSQSMLTSGKDNKFSLKKELNERKSFDRPWESPRKKTRQFTRNISPSELKFNSYHFEGYDVEDEAVQFSGLKTVYYADDCFMTVNLIERLYGNQDLGIHVCQGGHILYLYSYVCPEPHILQPYTFHLTFKNGIILAFGKRFIEESEKINDLEEYSGYNQKNKSSSSITSSSYANGSSQISTKNDINIKEDEDFAYDLKLSFPNGLMIEVLRKVVEPCYIKQYFLSQSEASSSAAKDENRRLFLPNGDLVKILRNEAVQIFKTNTSTVTASLDDLINASSSRSSNKSEETYTSNCALTFNKYEIITSCGKKFFIDQGEVISSKKIHIFQNMDIESNQMFFRRTDGTNYVIQRDGTLCAQFKDGTKMSSTPFLQETRHVKDSLEEEKNSHSSDKVFQETDLEIDFVIIYQEMTFEHPNYATMVYNTETQVWKVMLPSGSVISVGKEGNYLVKIDGQTELKIDKRFIQMNRFSSEQDLVCAVTADLTVFEKDITENIYCKMQNSTGDTYVVEANSNSYLQVKELSESISEEIYNSSLLQTPSSETNSEQKSECKRQEKLKGVNLSIQNKYFVVRKDITGFQVLHTEDVKKSLTEIGQGSVVYSQELSCSEKLRCFVLISPLHNKNLKKKKWEMDSILQNPKFIPNGARRKTSSTYGCPPSWMHPFPKRKTKFQIPDRLTCRVFVEINRTQFSPPVGRLDCSFCELPDSSETFKAEHKIQKIEDCMKKLAGDDQTLLKELYIQSARKILDEKKNMKPINTEKLKRYLETMKYQTCLQEYHKRALRYHLIPNYFHHPEGICWLIINDFIRDLKIIKPHKKQKLPKPPVPLQSFSKSVSTMSNDEIEYDLTWSTKRSYSNLSCITNISSKTVPIALARKEFCTCKIQSPRNVCSAPTTHFKLKSQVQSDENLQQFQQRVCDFNYDEVNALKKHKFEKPKTFLISLPMTLKNLMSLGLI